MTVEEETYQLADPTDGSTYGTDEVVRISISTSIIERGSATSDGVSQLIDSLLVLPELPHSPTYPEALTPPQPLLGAHKDELSDTMQLVWHIGQRLATIKLKSFELWICFDGKDKWIKVADIDALVLPMSCTLTKVRPDGVCHFIIRCVDVHDRLGPFSLPCEFCQDSERESIKK